MMNNETILERQIHIKNEFESETEEEEKKGLKIEWFTEWKKKITRHDRIRHANEIIGSESLQLSVNPTSLTPFFKLKQAIDWLRSLEWVVWKVSSFYDRSC